MPSDQRTLLRAHIAELTQLLATRERGEASYDRIARRRADLERRIQRLEEDPSHEVATVRARPDPFTFARALRILLPVLGDERQLVPLGHRTSLPVDRILAVPASPRLVASWQRRLERGDYGPVVNVTRYRLGERHWYLPHRGDHQVIACAQTGRARIGVHIRGEIRCHLCDVVLRDASLWRHDEKLLTLSEQAAGVATSLGIPRESAGVEACSP